MRYSLLGLGLCAFGVGADTTAQERWRLIADLHVPEVAQAPLNRVRAIAEAPRGGIYALDRTGVYEFDHDGRFVREMGRKVSGSPGPGEYVVADAIGVVGGELWLADGVTTRVTWFDESGDPTRTWLTPGVLGVSERGLQYRVTGVLSPGSPFAIEAPGGQGVAAYEPGGAVLIVADSAGVSAAQVTALDMSTASLNERVPPSTRVVMRQPFGFADSYGVDPYSRRIVVVRLDAPDADGNGGYRIEAFGAAGELAFEAHHPVRLAPLADAHIDAWLDSLLAQRRPESRRVMPDRVMREVLGRGLFRPARFPPIPNHSVGMFTAAVAYARDGSVWVRRTVTTGDAAWDVFGPDGRFRGQVRGPSSVEVLLITGEIAWGVSHDEFGVPRIVRLQIRE